MADAATTAGISVVAGQGSIVMIGSQARDLIANLTAQDPNLKDAITKISGVIELSRNKEAAETWKNFIAEASGERNKSKLTAFWNYMVALVPDISKMVESVATLSKLFT
ncbi:hypothetical protein SAMN05519104_6677 [Rhizobiales bacterium GAS188]|nr:hypothetical protein SAMN05519104_6677 [Rhizobiales bacterium GAS188]